MEALERLKLLSEPMVFEPGEELSATGLPACQKLADRKQDAIVTTNATLPGGKQIRLLKTLLTSACEHNCYYCPFRAGRDFRRATFKPDEFALLFNRLHKAGIVNGLFISSGIVGDGLRTQDQLIQTAEILRVRYQYTGYLHLKIMPGAEKAQVERSMQLADRVSINLEAANSPRLQRIAPKKRFHEELLQPLTWIQQLRATQSPDKAWNRRWPSSATQFVVGGSGESDREILTTTEFLYKQLRLSRSYFSAFKPVNNTPLEHLDAENPMREIRLYQASYLVRDYGYTLDELPFGRDGHLPLTADPKLAWADSHLKETPLEINRANRSDLLRVPGIGKKGVESILKERQHRKFADPSQLTKLGISALKASPYLLFDGKYSPTQLSLF